MGYFRQTKDFGVSWGVPGLRIGRSQYGTWWISIGLPLGFRVTKNLGPLRDPNPVSNSIPSSQPSMNSLQQTIPQLPIQKLTDNEKILKKMRESKD